MPVKLLQDGRIIGGGISTAIQAAASADEAAASATAAANSESGAADSASDAQLASANALSSATAAGAQIYPTISDGIAAVEVDDVFMVPILPSGGLDVREKTGASTSTSIGKILAPTQSATDATAGRLLKVGDFGVGADAPPNIADLDDHETPSGLWRVVSDTTNIASAPTGGGEWVIRHENWNSNNAAQWAWETKTATGFYVRRYYSGAWSDWEYFRGEERGSGPNGDYVRLADGTQICWGEVLIKPASDATTGNKQVDWTFPAEFESGASRTFVTHIINTTNPELRGRITARYQDANTADLRYYEGSGSASDVYTRGFAIGRWK